LMMTTCMWASSRDDAKCLRLLLAHGADKDARASNGVAALHFSVASDESVATLTVLLQANAGKEVKDSNGATPLMYAAQERYTACLLALLEAGADKDCVDKRGFTPLMVAAKDGLVETVRALLAAGCDPNLLNVHGASALYLAVRKKQVACVKELMKCKRVKMDVKTPQGDTMVELAAKQGADAKQLRRLAYACAACHVGVPGTAKMCSRCRVAYYCSRGCQAAHWPQHQLTCVAPAAVAEEAEAAAGTDEATIADGDDEDDDAATQ
jgi:hypothetical protein